MKLRIEKYEYTLISEVKTGQCFYLADDNIYPKTTIFLKIQDVNINNTTYSYVNLINNKLFHFTDDMFVVLVDAELTVKY